MSSSSVTLVAPIGRSPQPLDSLRVSSSLRIGKFVLVVDLKVVESGGFQLLGLVGTPIVRVDGRSLLDMIPDREVIKSLQKESKSNNFKGGPDS